MIPTHASAFRQHSHWVNCRIRVPLTRWRSSPGRTLPIPWIRTALISSLGDSSDQFLTRLLADHPFANGKDSGGPHS